jgi:hypothetical protein
MEARLQVRRTGLITVMALVMSMGPAWVAWSQAPTSPPRTQGQSPGQGQGQGQSFEGFLTGPQPGQTNPQIAVDGGGRVYWLWVDSLRRQRADIKLQRSVDGGVTWVGEAITVDEDKPASGEGVSPVLVSDAAGRVMVLWRAKVRRGASLKEMKFVMSPDGGATWERPSKVLNRGQQGLSGDLAADGQGNVYATWYDERRRPRGTPGPEGRAFDIYFNRSQDFGRTWLTEDVPLTGTEPGAQGRGFQPRLQSDGKGGVYIAWVETRTGRTEIFFRASHDHGKTWDPEINVSRGGLSATNHQLLVDSAGNVMLVWTDNRSGPSDVFFARSDDGGRHWATPVRLTRTRIGSSRAEVPHMAASRDGRVYVAWQDKRNGREDIYLNVSADGGKTWLDQDIRLDRDDIGTGVSEFPHVLVRADGSVVVAWSDDRNGYEQVLLTVSADGGKTWLDREIRVDTDTKPRHRARGVKLAANAAGVIYAVWEDWEGGGSAVQKSVAYRRVVLPDARSAAAPAK